MPVGIYKITSPSNRVYIGQSHNIKRRFWRYNGLESKGQPKLHNSFLKYGVHSHVFKVVHELPDDVMQDVLDNYEALFMQCYRDGGVDLLNTKEAGSRGKHSEETKLKMSIKSKGRGAGIKKGPPSETTKLRLSLAQKGIKKSKEATEKNRLCHIGLKASEETKNKMRQIRLGKKPSIGTIEKCKNTKIERGITMTAEVIEKGIPTRFQKGLIPWNKGTAKPKEAKMKTYGLGLKHSDESKLKMRKAALLRTPNFLGKKHSDEAKLKMSNSRKGQVAWNKGKKLTDEHRLKLSLAKLGKKKQNGIN